MRLQVAQQFRILRLRPLEKLLPCSLGQHGGAFRQGRWLIMMGYFQNILIERTLKPAWKASGL